MTTIYDVAKAAGVTATTVSYVLSGKGSISEATRAKVLKHVQELGYRPNLIARSLIKQSTRTIGLVVPSIGNPFYAELAEAMERLTYAAGFRIFITNTYRNEELGRELLDDLMSRRVDGIIAVSEGISLEALQSLRTLSSSQLPVVCCLWEEVEPEGATAINFDFQLAGRLAAEHLLGLGHQKIGIITDGVSTDGFSFEKIRHHLRLSGFKESLESAGYPLAPSLLGVADSSFANGKVVAQLLLQQPDAPTAIFATNDLMALAAISAASEAGLHVPHDLSVIGLDNISLASYNVPPLTTIALDHKTVAQKALTSLFLMLEGKVPPLIPLLKPELVVRGSTAPPGLLSQV